MSRKLDAAIAEALGYEVEYGAMIKTMGVFGASFGTSGHCYKRIKNGWEMVRHYSTDGNAMLELDREMRERGFSIQINRWIDQTVRVFYVATYTTGDNEFYADADTMPEALSLAAYKALTGKDGGDKYVLGGVHVREILFRGKRIDNGEWVEGYLLITQISGAYIMGTVRNVQNQKRGGVSVGDKIWQHEVDPATIGQYTGLKDKNGKRIFEGDIIRHHSPLIETSIPEEKEVYSKWGAFCIDGKHGPVTFANMLTDRIEIIGTIHEQH